MRGKLILLPAAAAVAAGIYAASIHATPATGFVGATLAKATYASVDANVQSSMHAEGTEGRVPAGVWQSLLRTNGATDVYVQSNTWQPGGSTGWHTHPGPSLVLVTSGSVTAYDGDDSTCTPHVYTAGQGFVDEGGGHVHLLKNQSTTQTATTVAVQMIPEGTERRQDAAAPAACGS